MDNSSEVQSLEELPEIEVNFFPVKVSKISTSGRVYLFSDLNLRDPAPGKIIILKDNTNENVMAFQVLQNFTDKKSFAAKRLKRYQDIRTLEVNQEYRAFEKKADITKRANSMDKSEPAPPKANAFDSTLDEVQPKELPEEQTKQSLTNDFLDNKSAPPSDPVKNSQTKMEELQNEVEVTADDDSDEKLTIDPYSHWLSVGFGFIKNNGPPSEEGTHYFTSGNLRYGIRILHQVYLDLPQAQDSLVLEGGLHFYKTLNYATAGDAYGIVAVSGVLRYNVFFSERFGVFAYAGLLKNGVTSATQSEDSSLTALNSNIPAGGGGLLLQMGPSWYTRVDIGIESIGLGLVLRF